MNKKATKDFPGLDGLHVGEMAEEMAEYELGSLSVQEALDLAGTLLYERWAKRAQQAPQGVKEAYMAMMGHIEEFNDEPV